MDLLTEDKPIPNQKYVLISFLTQEFLEINDEDDDESKEYKNERKKKLTTKGIKIRGSYDSYEDAVARAENLKIIDPYHNIYIGEVGKWLPFEDNPEKAKDVNYSNQQLNKLMKEYIKEQEKGKGQFEARKNNMIREALLKNTKVSNKKIDEEVDSIISNINSENKTDIESNIENMETTFEQNKNEIEEIKNKIKHEEDELKNKESHLNKINEELENAKRIFNQLQIDMNNNSV